MYPIKEIRDEMLLTKYNIDFTKFLNTLDDSTKHIIRKNKKLNEMYDLFLDFIIDSSQHLDYKEAKKAEKDMYDK